MRENYLLDIVCQHVSDAILTYLSKHDMSRYKFAQKAQISTGMLDHYICMRYAPNAVNCMKLAEAMDITVDELIRGKKP
jgi:ribosome-binding protein aMBF1 (putative translation factor)